MSKLTFQQRGKQDTRIPVGQRRTAGGKALEDNRAAFAAKQLKQEETAQLTKEEDELLKGKSGTKQLAKKDEEEIGQAKFSNSGPPVQREEQPAKPNNTGLPDKLKNGIESLSGMSMDNVKVHYNSAKPKQLNALAYAQGTDIHVGPGQAKHLPHEAWHVVQQAQGRVRPTMQMKGGVPVNDDAGLEREADVMGGKAVQGQGGSDWSKERPDTAEHIPDHKLVPHMESKVKQMTKPKGKKGKTSKKTAKVAFKKKKLKVRNSTDSYTTGWIGQLVVPGGVEAGPRSEAQRLSYILGGTACVGGHMINDQMGGSGAHSNIIPITSSMNGQHKRVENRITKNLNTIGTTAREYKYDMEVMKRSKVTTPYGVVTNWPLFFRNKYSVRDSATQVKLSTNPGEGVAPDTWNPCFEPIKSNWTVS